ncbi:unnamed protein product [Mytilus coruscus]|uniref:Uncharacterized protein n=1 Tax=Mytilus coruscus TaxID=42192 RepID=A0A6J8B0T1_MYTCO|nr:unnamed protein product [Mytilus coruscus]
MICHIIHNTLPYVELEERNIQEYFCHLQQSSLFSTGDRLILHHIFTDTDATAEQTDSLMRYRQFGQEDLANYVNCFLLKTTDSKTKPPPRKKRNLKTFSISKVTVHRQKKEIKDQKTVISCLRKKIAFSKLTNKPVSNLEQFIQLPRAICDAEGVPEKGQKSWATTVFKKLYPESFLTNLPVFISAAKSLAFIIDAMFIINTSPLSIHKTFSEYAAFLFELWVVRRHHQLSASEVHIIFDHPNRNGVSPKDLERSRRDTEIQSSDYEKICPNTVLPQNWRSFIGVRTQKRLLVNFLSDKFLQLANEKFSNSDFLLVTAGGFDNEFKDKALCSKHGSITEYFDAAGDHEEADTRVWLHAVTSSAINIIIYSPDTDVYFIGLPLLKNINKSIYVQLKDTPYEKSFIDMNTLVRSLKNDVCFQGIENIEECIQIVYIFSGCDYTSFFKGYGKKTFFDTFRKYAGFISGGSEHGLLCDINSQSGLHSFYRLISAVYFSRHCSAFLLFSSPKTLFDTLNADTINEKHLMLISDIREKMWERILTEVEIMPNADALKLHWQRCCWVFMFFSQASNQFLKASISFQILDGKL